MSPRGLTVTLVVLGLGLCPQGTLAKKPKPQPCPGGRFMVEGQSLIPDAASPVPDVVVITDRRVSIVSGCEPARFRRHVTRGGTTVRVHWRRCGELRKVRLRAKVVPN